MANLGENNFVENSEAEKNFVEYLSLNLREQFTPFNLPAVEEISAALNETLPDQQGMILSALRGRGQGIYKIQLTQPIDNISALKVTLREGIEVPLKEFIAFNPAHNRKVGTLVTFAQAAMGDNKYIQSEEIDKVMAKFGEVVKPTIHQYHKGTQMLNGNRFCVVDVGNTTIPSAITVLNPQTQKLVKLNTRYKGQKWWCRRCQCEHVGPCESLQAFYKAKDERAKEPIYVKVVSDSTLRRAEQIGLRADVLCMSGAGVGHLANVMRDDPQMQDKGEIVMVIGQNDVLNSKDTGNFEFVYTVDKSIEKVRKEMERQNTKSLAIVMKVDDPTNPTLSPDLARREKYLEREMGGLESERIKIIKIPEGIEEDVTNHPNDQGTVDILKEVDKAVNTELFLNPAILSVRGCMQGCKLHTDMAAEPATSWVSLGPNLGYARTA